MYLDEEEYGTFSFNDSKIVFVDEDGDSNVFEYEMFDDGILIDGNFYKKADKSLDLHKTYGGSLSGVYRTEGYRVFYEYYFDGTNVYEVSGFLYDSESEYRNYGELYEEAWDKKEGTLFGDEYYFLGDYLVIDNYLYSKVDRKKTTGSITGIWENTETTIEFKNGGVAVVDGDSANYSYKNGTLVLTYEGKSISLPCTVYDNNLMFLESPYDDDEFIILTRIEGASK